MYVVAAVSFAAIGVCGYGWAVATYHQQYASRWWIARGLPAAVVVHVLAVLLAVATGDPPDLYTYRSGLYLSLFPGLIVAPVATFALEDHFARRFVAKPADLRALEHPQPERVHAALDPERAWPRRRIDAEEGDVPPRRLPAPAPREHDQG